MEPIRADEHINEIELAEQLFEHRQLMVLSGGVAGLVDRYAQ